MAMHDFRVTLRMRKKQFNLPNGDTVENFIKRAIYAAISQAGNTHPMHDVTHIFVNVVAPTPAPVLNDPL